MKEWIISLILLFSLELHAQGVQITSQLLNPDLKTFMLSDFNFTGRGTSASEIFEVMLMNTSAVEQQCTLTLTIRAEYQGALAFGETNPFILTPQEIIRITNRNLFTKAQRFSLEEYYIENRGQSLINELLASGALPADIYYFIFDLQQNGMSQSSTILRIDITNPRSIDLVSPGSDAAAAEVEQVFTPYPLFRWESDMIFFRLVIAERLADSGDDLSPEEVMQQRIVFQRNFRLRRDPAAPVVDTEELAATLFQYPIAGVRPLEENKIYYWQVTGLVETSGAPLEFPSEIWKFKLVAAQGAQFLTPLQQQLIALVSGIDTDLLAPGGSLYNFIPNESVRRNGVQISEATILNTLAKLLNGDYRALELTVE